MGDEINKKVIDIFSSHAKELTDKHKERVKSFAGFSYVKLEKDNNGNRFSKEHLLKYASGCHYIVRVMRELDGEVVLYNYDVQNDELFRFIKSFEENTLNGTIIEIDKYFPENPA